MRRSLAAVWGAVVGRAVLGAIGAIGAIGALGVIGLLGSLLGGCSGSLSSKPDGGGAGACTDYITKYCQRLQACEPGVLAIYGFTSVADCAAYNLQWCNEALTAPQTGETTALVQQCGDGTAAMSCSDFLEGKTVPACLPHGGGVANGGSCSSEWQCASGRCFAQTFGACGTCVPAVPEGQTCNGDGFLGSDCADNLVCAVATPNGSVVCTPNVAIGAACAETSVCPSNASCDVTTHVCTQSPAIGQTCDPSATTYCDPTKAAAECDLASSSCLPISVAQAGQACDMLASGTYAQCSGSCDIVGDGGSSSCHPFVAEGNACTDYDLCTLGAACTGGVCAPLVCDGAASDAAVPAATAAAAFDGRRPVRPPRAPMARRP